MSTITAQDKKFLAVALEEAQTGYEEGGVPIGAVLVDRNGKMLGRGRNMRVQKGSATLHVSFDVISVAVAQVLVWAEREGCVHSGQQLRTAESLQ